tara:strand:+ start:5590 stop:6018 length:429 start_codon:yes stop_codon:yes gene_type:complete
MKLSIILQEKGGEVVTVKAKDSLQRSAEILDQNRIGATVAVDAKGKVVGVLSERDIVRRVAEQGAEALKLKVEEAMTRDVLTGTPETTILDGLELMTDRRIRHLPVIENGELVGIVSIGDLVKWRISQAVAEAEAMKEYIHA